MKMRGARRRGAGGRRDVRPRRSRRAALAVVALALVLLAVSPDVAHACPVCFDRDDEARIAFLATTGLLTLVPLGLVAGTGLWLRRRAREIAEEEERGEG
ncbi:MAG: hypothetical protein OXI76_16850 [Gemmatimonadota bacterium]|nr:hypothetical protein [Gemmatimonadota bacterium]